MTSPPPSRGGNLLDEPSLGQDTVYDGAADMKSTAAMFGPRGGMWATKQNYSSAFRSATPRPWQRPASNKFPQLGPGQYNAPIGPNENTHAFSASLSWQTRGRSGPVGFPFDASRKSSSFQSTQKRFGLEANVRRRGPVSREDIFVLASDARKASVIQNDFCNRMQDRALHWNTFASGRANTAGY